MPTNEPLTLKTVRNPQGHSEILAGCKELMNTLFQILKKETNTKKSEYLSILIIWFGTHLIREGSASWL